MIFVVAYGLKILFKNHLNYNFYSVITFSIRKIYIYNTEKYLEPATKQLHRRCSTEF